MKKSMRFYFVLIVITLQIRSSYKDDELNLDDRLSTEFHLLEKVRRLVRLLIIKYKDINLSQSNGNVNRSLVNLDKLNLELKKILNRLEHGNADFLFNNKYRKMLELIRLVIDEMPNFETLSNQTNQDNYVRFKYYFEYGLSSICSLFTKLDCWICKLEHINRKFDKLQKLFQELKLLTTKADQKNELKQKQKTSIVNKFKRIFDLSIGQSIRRNFIRISNRLTIGYSFAQEKYRNFTNQICSVTHNYWELISEKFNEFYLKFNFDKSNDGSV